MNSQAGDKDAVTNGAPRGGSGPAAAGFILALLSLIAAAASGLGNRAGAWDFRTGFVVLRSAAFGAALASLISLIGLLASFRKKGFYTCLSAAGLILGLMVLYVPLRYWRAAHAVPPIHDITTDTDNPPKFVAILPLRKGPFINPSEYGGPGAALLQRAAYPDIRPLVLPVDRDRAFDYALAAARKLHWTIIGSDANEGRIEATDTTFWFGFKDDIVVRITPVSPKSSRIDLRSVSRVGRSDIGKNAQRVRKYLKAISGMQGEGGNA